MYGFAKRYYEENGDLDVPKRYKTADGYNLGHWLTTQRRVRAGAVPGDLTPEKIARLDAIGMRWESASDMSWNRHYAEAEAYFHENGHLRIPVDYSTESGFALGTWIANLRSWRKSGTDRGVLNDERIAALDRIGMVWSIPDYLILRYHAAAVEYRQQFGDLNVPVNYVTKDGLRLGAWLSKLKQSYRDGTAPGTMTEGQIEMLNELGIDWRSPFQILWDIGYEHAAAYHAQNGHLDVSSALICEDGYRLGRWLDRQRDVFAAGKLSADRKEKLDQLGMVWSRLDSWEQRYRLAEIYYQEHGNLNIPAKYVTEGIWLAKWLDEQKQIYRGNRPGKALTADQIKRLEALGVQWKISGSQKAWTEQYQAAKLFYEAHGHLIVPQDYLSTNGKKLGIWIYRQRKYKAEGKLTKAQIQKLDSIGMVWTFDDPWEIGYSHAEEYYRAKGNLLVPNNYVSPDGYRLGNWISNQRFVKKGTSQYSHLSQTQIMRLESIGMVWNTLEYDWKIGFDHTKAYLTELEGKKYKTTYTSPDGYGTGQWIRGQLRAEKQGRLSQEHRRMLEEIGMVFS